VRGSGAVPRLLRERRVAPTGRPVFSASLSEPEVRIVTEPSVAAEPVLEAIRSELHAFNRAANPAYYSLRDLPGNEPRALHVVAYDPAGGVVGGVIGTTCLEWLDIEIMAVRAGDRRRGIGRRLVRAAESEAVLRGCRWAAVDTADFQAPGFYEKLGYAVVGRFEDRDGHGHAKFFLTRRIG
jgi:ribosomal protein S18 acetylase RimI-like enzyme